MKRILIAWICAGLSTGAFAMRCGNEIVEIGDSEQHIRKLCNIKDEYIVNNNNSADIKRFYTDKGDELLFIDGKLKNIDGGR